MLSKSEIKELKCLHQKKYREALQRFLVEGDKLVREAIAAGVAIREIYALSDWDGLELAQDRGIEVRAVNQKQLDQICELRNPNMAAALISMPKTQVQNDIPATWQIYLDRVRDPGNLGTILRIADWYGIEEVICSPDTVETYNQKVVQSSMGAIFRVSVREMSEDDLIKSAQSAKIDLFAATMEGQSIHSIEAPRKGVLLMGNEANGLSDKLLRAAKHHIKIPGKGAAESLNVGVATGILVDWSLRSSGYD